MSFWSGILDGARAANWNTNVGATIATRTTVYQSFTSSATAAQINTALAACPDEQVVLLGAGTFTLNDGLLIQNSNTTLRGAGANQTKLIFTGSQSGFFSVGAAININSNENNYGPNGGVNTANWTAGYAIGDTVITLSSVTSLAVGDMIILDQQDDTADNYPAAGDIVVAQSTTGNFSKQGGNTFGRSGRSQQKPVIVTAINGFDVTISPPIDLPNWRSGKNPGAWWGSNAPVNSVGLENFSFDYSNQKTPGVMMFNAKHCWIKGVRGVVIGTPPDTFSHVRLMNACRCTVRDSYFYGPELTGTDHYGVTAELTANNLIENNIGVNNPGMWEHNGADSGSVWAYNYHPAQSSWVNSILEHEAGIMMVLYEGNDGSGASSDVIHGTAQFQTFFRNRFSGGATGSTGNTVFWQSSYHRFYNYIGNVLGYSSNTIYERDATTHDGAEVFLFGENNASESGTGNPPLDSRVKATSMRWGNWDAVGAAVRWQSSEVPTAITNFANAVPADHVLPASFYLSARPPFWPTTYGTPAWPAIGPDVTGGNVSGTGGFANKIPARLVYENMTDDAAYSAGTVRSFNASNYGVSSSGATATTITATNVKVGT